MIASDSFRAKLREQRAAQGRQARRALAYSSRKHAARRQLLRSQLAEHAQARQREETQSGERREELRHKRAEETRAQTKLTSSQQATVARMRVRKRIEARQQAAAGRPLARPREERRRQQAVAQRRDRLRRQTEAQGQRQLRQESRDEGLRARSQERLRQNRLDQQQAAERRRSATQRKREPEPEQGREPRAARDRRALPPEQRRSQERYSRRREKAAEQPPARQPAELRQQQRLQHAEQQRLMAVATRRTERREQRKGGAPLQREARREKRTAPARPRIERARLPQFVSGALGWLRVTTNRVVDRNGNPVCLRGVNVLGLESLDDRNLSVITEHWGANVVRLPFRAGAVLDGNGALSSLDRLVAALTQAGAYALIAMEAPAGNEASVPDRAALRCWRLLASRYRSEPGVLYEVQASPESRPQGWADALQILIGAIRREHPASLVLVGSVASARDLAVLPLRFATGKPVHNVVYTIRVRPSSMSLLGDPRLRAFARAHPLFASAWSDCASDLGRSSEAAAYRFEALGIGWAAANWNADPRLVLDAAAHKFRETRFGLLARRMLARSAFIRS